jgi:hypothetical protein
MNERKLTQLEAAMLGLYLQGYRWIYGYSPTREITASKNLKDWRVVEVKGSLCEGIPSLEDIEILPWLTAHNVPIPEVADSDPSLTNDQINRIIDEREAL